MSQAQTIDEVVEALTAIVDESIAGESRVGYFAALYRKVTIDIRDKIAAGFFEDGARMERLDVIFANRYLDAVQARKSGASTTRAWAFAFDVTTHRTPIVLQHLLLGMNAHINLDLGVAASQTVPFGELQGLKPDFDRINGVLAGLVGDVQAELAEIWPLFRLFDRFLGDADTAVINFSMELARENAWSVAQRVSPLTGDDWASTVATIDRDVTLFAQKVRYPGPVLRAVTGVIRLGELGSVRRKIEILE